MDRRDDQVAFVLAVVVIRHHHDLAALESPDRIDDTLLVISHSTNPCLSRLPQRLTEPASHCRWRC